MRSGAHCLCFLLDSKGAVDFEQLLNCYQDSPTARDIIGEYKINLADFLSAYLTHAEEKMILIAGDITLACKYIGPYLNKKLVPIALAPAKNGKYSTLLGACLFFDYATNVVMGS